MSHNTQNDYIESNLTTWELEGGYAAELNVVCRAHIELSENETKERAMDRLHKKIGAEVFGLTVDNYAG